MHTSSSISAIRGNSDGTAFLEGATGALWFVTASGDVLLLSTSGVKDVQMGAHHGVVLNHDGTVDGFMTSDAFYAKSFQTGTGPADLPLFTLARTALSGIVEVSCGTYFSSVLDSSGNVFVAGSNQEGQFGNGQDSISMRTNRLTSDTFIQTMSDARSVTAGSGFLFVTKTDGTLWVSGKNPCGAVGLCQRSGNTNVFRDTGLRDVTEVHASHRLSVVKDSTGAWWYTGDARDAPGTPRAVQFMPTDTWMALPGFDPAKVVLSGDLDGMLIEHDGSVKVKSPAADGPRLGVMIGNRMGFSTSDMSGEDVAVTNLASFIRSGGEWYSAHKRSPDAGLSFYETRTKDQRFSRVAHPAIWHTAKQMRSLGLSWNETVLLAEATS